MSSLQVIVKRSRGNKHQKETEKQQQVIVTENNLFNGFTSGVRNYDQEQSGKLDRGVAWNSSPCGRFLDGRFATPSTVTVKLAGLRFTIIKNIGITQEYNVFFVSYS